MLKQAVGLALLAQNGQVDVVMTPLANIQVNAGSKTYTLVIPADRQYTDFIFEMYSPDGSFLPAMITQVLVKPNGKQFQTFAMPDLISMNKYFTMPDPGLIANYYRIQLSQLRPALLGGTAFVDPTNNVFFCGDPGSAREVTTLNCKSQDGAGREINQLTFQFTCTGVTNAASAINVYALASPPYPGGAGLVKMIDQTTFNAVAGQNVLAQNNGLNFGDASHAFLDQLFFFTTGGSTLDNWQVWYNGSEIRQRSEALNEFIQTMAAPVMRASQVGASSQYVLDFTESLLGDKILAIGDPNTALQIRFTASAAGAITVYQVSEGYLAL